MKEQKKWPRISGIEAATDLRETVEAMLFTLAVGNNAHSHGALHRRRRHGGSRCSKRECRNGGCKCSRITPSASSLVLRYRRQLSSADVVDVPTDLIILRGVPACIRSDNGPEFVAGAVRRWIAAVGARTAFIEPGSPWENGYIESFNGNHPA